MSKFSTKGDKTKTHAAWDAVTSRDPSHQDPNEKIDLGPSASVTFKNDPKMLLFTLSRYKFVAKMLRGARNVLEIGCQEGIGARLVAKDVGSYTGIDFFTPYIDECQSGSPTTIDNAQFLAHDILDGPVAGEFDAAFCIDVIEHIANEDEPAFLKNVLSSLTEHGTMIVGAPTLESQQYASAGSKMGHINCKSGEQFQNDMDAYFHNTFLFGMNDEVIHTGYNPMCQYHFLICTGPKRL
ncbi:class I SAM-dependent methyltransferase [Magnetovibrio sp. PR-2]|uniref:class I SAM-dependent methyltransferase n=1 Tax=Magnetovibrio sp. PR-2 TaxID=3120356 RepID=UPI002FCDE87A